MNEQTPEDNLANAVDRGLLDEVKALLDGGQDVNMIVNAAKRWTPLSLAASRGHLEIVELLLDRGADKDHADVDNSPPINIAAHARNWPIVKLLAERGASIHHKDSWGNTALSQTRARKQKRLAALLEALSPGSKPEA